MHTEPHPLAGKKVRLRTVQDAGPGQPGPDVEYIVEDWRDKLTGKSWMFSDSNPAAMKYAMRSGFAFEHIPMDDDVVYGKIYSLSEGGHEIGLGHLVHTSALGAEV